MNKILIISFVLLLTFSLTSTIHAVDSVHEPSAMISHGGDTDVSREALLKKRVFISLNIERQAFLASASYF